MFTSFARNLILTTLQRAVEVGYLEIEESGVVHRFGSSKDGASRVHITVLNDSFWNRIILLSFTVGEAYVIGDIKLDSDNLEIMTGLNSLFNRFTSAVSGLSNALFGQTRTQSRLNAVASYDLSNELYKAFLSKEMMYSSALWNDDEGDGVQDNLLGVDLEAAQLRKIHHVLRKARVKPGHRVLEFGSGWGGLAIEAARTYGCQVDTITLSIEQKRLAEERICEAGLQDLVRVHLMDYREIPPEFEKKFDALVSVEMLEHVGTKYYQTYFKAVDKALKSRDAVAVVTCSTLPEAKYTQYQAKDFARKYFWPNGSLPSPTAIILAANAGSQGRLTINGVENHGRCKLL
ncbi:Mycolic acid cyclopropane synthetase-domain-containing protein [Multifurca ochricompacta]|uniref:Mycolic acid cyclopropane synthetase-domain-containing protein n=1 Tax=Multifurca ochricompacta TaxID=376703 RepID=A0AAD4QKL7_9AGAM|nr:Mycolic acid cyclopropane synthetase-domain-containing protein [Multifurca ochricompacta]